jgi:hypothetical protein
MRDYRQFDLRRIVAEAVYARYGGHGVCQCRDNRLRSKWNRSMKSFQSFIEKYAPCNGGIRA